jgi:carbon storage regulator
MLVLTRRVGEGIVIGDSIEVSVVAIASNDVRVGIRAPRGVPVHRAEVYAARKAARDDDEDGVETPQSR